MCRYALLYTFGGFYMDLDIECHKPLEALRAYPFIMPQTRPVGFSNDFLASTAGVLLTVHSTLSVFELAPATHHSSLPSACNEEVLCESQWTVGYMTISLSMSLQQTSVETLCEAPFHQDAAAC